MWIRCGVSLRAHLHQRGAFPPAGVLVRFSSGSLIYKYWPISARYSYGSCKRIAPWAISAGPTGEPAAEAQRTRDGVNRTTQFLQTNPLWCLWAASSNGSKWIWWTTFHNMFYDTKNAAILQWIIVCTQHVFNYRKCYAYSHDHIGNQQEIFFDKDFSSSSSSLHVSCGEHFNSSLPEPWWFRFDRPVFNIILLPNWWPDIHSSSYEIFSVLLHICIAMPWKKYFQPHYLNLTILLKFIPCRSIP